MSWRLSGNLVYIRQSIWDHFPDHVTVGSIGDAAHAASTSDHNPDGRGIVCAIDVMYSVGANASAVVRASVGRGDLAYVIHNRTIWSASHGWGARSYTGSDPHTNHVHISSFHTAGADSNHVGLSFGSSPTPVPNPSSPVPAWSGPDLGRGSKGQKVKDVQYRLNTRGYAHLDVDGDYGPATEDRVRRFQRFAHLAVDGRVGIHTWTALWAIPIS